MYAAVIYVLLLLEGDTSTSPTMMKEPMESKMHPLDAMLERMRYEGDNWRAIFGGGIQNFVSLPITTNVEGRITGFAAPHWQNRTCTICSGSQDPNCFSLFFRTTVIDTLRDAGFMNSTIFYQYLTSVNFNSVQEFMLHYLVTYQKSTDPQYTIRFRRVCQLVSGRRYPDPRSRGTIEFTMRHDINHISPCNVHRRALSPYTGLHMLDHQHYSYPFHSDMIETDQFLQFIGQEGTLSFFRARAKKYDNLRRPKNKCKENNNVLEKYPSFAGAFDDCIEQCLLNSSNVCQNRLRSLDRRSNQFCVGDIQWLNTTKQEESFEKLKANEPRCIKECANLRAGYCTKYLMHVELEDGSVLLVPHSPHFQYFYDVLHVTASKTIMSFVEKPQLQIEALFSQIGGNLGLFLGASWMSFIHLFAVCCCHSSLTHTKTSKLPTPEFERRQKTLADV